MNEKEIAHWKMKLQEKDKEIEKLNRIIKQREREIQELYLLLDKKIEFENRVKI